MALKLNMAKAYGRVELGFLEICMRRMGFVCGGFLLLWIPTNVFKPSLGLR